MLNDNEDSDTPLDGPNVRMKLLPRQCRRQGNAGVKGVVLNGQPGVGKSTCNIFFLAACLAYKQTIIFTTSNLEIYYFGEAHVWKFVHQEPFIRPMFPDILIHAYSPLSTLEQGSLHCH
ncbi:hypothetical protein GYMLUDRAFT_679106 [Collybiopsis luxurians FD-317 M1]|uniref:Uncharacterized protein n=1 Tax=Collybiopsis luxurians FD-317 M1 TaxID=944289 RepID=A0A0D0BV47_9AGAR|nr:hypothetical protein GYMLUDRAFT_679106 [Collybiopsis luxurians FD-317 M1]